MQTMKWFQRALAPAAASLALVCAPSSFAAVDYFLKIDGIEGESQDDKHKGEIDVLSWSWGVSLASAASTSRSASKPCVHEFNFTKRTDKATPPLIAGAVMGTFFPRAVLTARKAGGTQQEYLKYEMKTVLVSSYQTGGSSGGDAVPTDQFSLNFASMTVEYQAQKPDGSLEPPVRATINGGC